MIMTITMTRNVIDDNDAKMSLKSDDAWAMFINDTAPYSGRWGWGGFPKMFC